MLKKIIKIENGDFLEIFKIFKCDICKGDISESWPYYHEGEKYHLCVDCALRNGKITGEQWMKSSGFTLSGTYTTIVQADGQITVKRNYHRKKK